MEFYQNNKLTEKEEIKALAYKVNILDKKYEYGGPTLHYDRSGLYIDESDKHVAFIATSGGGKTTSGINPAVHSSIRAGESFLITDVKQEVFNQFYDELKREEYRIVIINFREPWKSTRWNPLRVIYELFRSGIPKNVDKAMRMLKSLVAVCITDTGSNDPYWANAARKTLMSIIQALFISAKPEQINLFNAYYMLETGKEKFATSNYLEEFFKDFIGEDNPVYTGMSSYFNNAPDTRRCVESVLHTGLGEFITSEVLIDTFSHDDFDITSLDSEKTAIFVIVQDESTIYHNLAGIFVSQVYEQYISLAQEKYNGKLPRRVNFFLEEFGQLKIDNAPSMLSASRSRNIRIFIVLQSFAQLEKYGSDNAKAIKENCGIWYYFYTNDIATLEELSRLSGERRVDASGQPSTKPLLSVTDLQSFKMGQVLIRMRGIQYVTKLPHFEVYGLGEPKHVEMKEREFKEISLFDMKTLVRNKKREKFESITSNLKVSQ